MEVTINGKRRGLQDAINLGQLLSKLGIERSTAAIELNKNIIKRDRYDSVILHDGDSIEIVHLVGGG